MSENKDNIFESVEKPEKWPVNNREASIQEVHNFIEEFDKNPSYENREILSSLVSQTDLNEINDLGMFRITEYEVALLNSIYMYALKMNFNVVKLFVYRNIYRFTRNYKMTRQMMSRGMPHTRMSIEVKEYSGLMLPLKLFYVCYANFNIEKKRTFPYQIVNELNELINTMETGSVEFLESALIPLINDVSYFQSSKVFPIMKWNRTEIYKVFSSAIGLINTNKKDPTERPLMGVLCTSISNWVLKSRYNYNDLELFKCMGDFATRESFKNNEIWMNNINSLNDKREGKVLSEVFSNKKWMKYDWAKNIDPKSRRKVFVSSFTKTIPTKAMRKKYGDNVYGYKSDRITNILSPIIKHESLGTMLGQVVHYDILYDRNLLKEEINYLCSIIDLFKVDDEVKKEFFNIIIQYWPYSIKDKRWEYEKERRYEIVLFDYYVYLHQRIENGFLKQKTTLLKYPDMAMKNHIYHSIILYNRMEKLNSIAVKDYIFCKVCLNSDFDSTYKYEEGKSVCTVCGSKKLEIHKIEKG